MSKKEQATESGLEQVNDRLTEMTTKVQDNKKIISVVSCVVIAIVAIVLAYVYFFRGPAITKANDSIGAADLYLAQGNDSLALATYENVAQNFSYDAGNRAALNAAILLYQKGDYKKAAEMLENYDAKDDIIGAGASSLRGDCMVNLDKLGDAEKCYKEAIKCSDDNPAYTPFFMLKLARVYAAQGKHADEADLYKEVMDKYPTYGQMAQIDVEKYYERARLEAEQGKK